MPDQASGKIFLRLTYFSAQVVRQTTVKKSPDRKIEIRLNIIKMLATSNLDSNKKKGKRNKMGRRGRVLKEFKNCQFLAGTLLIDNFQLKKKNFSVALLSFSFCNNPKVSHFV